MSQIIQKFKIFLASPSDLMDDRLSVEEVVKELNLTYGNRNNLVLELIKWETHSAPAISNNGTQGIIDYDIGTDYDIFLGILWKKFGTPTDKCDSGTEQEFENAFNRFQTNPNSLQILFYFKSS